VWWGGRAIQTVGLSREQARRMIAESCHDRAEAPLAQLAMLFHCAETGLPARGSCFGFLRDREIYSDDLGDGCRRVREPAGYDWLPGPLE
jgi:hypothetical protein